MTQQAVLKNSKLAQGHLLLGLLVIICSVFILSPANGADAKKNQQVMQYDVYAGGIHALQANLNVDQSKKEEYDIALEAKTYGLLAKLANWQGTFESGGWAGNPNKVKFHKSTAMWRGEKEVKNYSYNKNGTFAGYSIKDDKNDGSKKAVDKELVDGTSDVLTATLNIMQSLANDGKCEGSTDIFDGKRRYTLVFKEKKRVELTASRWNVYGGPAIECSVEVKPGAGKWHEKPRGWLSIQEQGREKGTIPTVWFAQMSKGQPAVPVKVRVKTNYGTLFMHLTEYQTAGKTLKLKD